MTPKVSIIIPVYNVEQYLRQCLDSAKNQTLTDIEIICVDDGSTDNSRTILEKYAQADNRFKIVHQKNSGQACARNVALNMAQGEYILFLDSDDRLDSACCCTAINRAKDSDVDLVHFQYRAMGQGADSFATQPILFGNWESEQSKMEMLRLIPSLWQYLYRRDFLNTHHLRFPEKQKFEDVVFVYQARFLANKILECPKSLYEYRVGSGYSTRASQEASYFELPVAYNRMIESVTQLGAELETQRMLCVRKLEEVYFAWTIKKQIRRPFSKLIAKNLLPMEQDILRTASLLDKNTWLFYQSISGTLIHRVTNTIRYKMSVLWDWFVERLYYRSSLYKKHEQEIRWLKEVIENHDEFFQKGRVNKE